MINASELRIGNLLYWNPGLVSSTTLPPIQIEVSSIMQERLGYLSPGAEHRVEPFEDDILEKDALHRPLEEFEPIPLTPDILERCGFVAEGGAIETRRFVSKPLEAVFQANDEVNFRLADLSVNCRHLHQVQNLYFALTSHKLQFA